MQCLSKMAKKNDEDTTTTAKGVKSHMDSPPCSVHNGAGASDSGRRRSFRQFSFQEQSEGFHNRICKYGLDVYCPNKHLGCEWTGSLTDVVEHMNYECECLPVSLLWDENVEMPMIIMMRDFEQLKHDNESWYSPVFCTHEKGYHFRLRVDANGWCGTGDAVAVVVSIVKGDYDDHLQWPFEGTITVQALNHISNSAHSTLQDFEFSNGGYECQRVTDETQPEYGCWCDQFIMHKSLEYNSMKKSQYLKNDCLFLLVNYTPLNS